MQLEGFSCNGRRRGCWGPSKARWIRRESVAGVLGPAGDVNRRRKVGHHPGTVVLSHEWAAGQIGDRWRRQLLALRKSNGRADSSNGKAAHAEIVKGPELEFAREDLAIIRWTSTNPGGDDEHLAVMHYGTDPKDLSQTAKSHIRLNRAHAETIFRVRVDGLTAQTTYYYMVTSMGADGESDGVQSPLSRFTTPAPGEQIVAFPQPK